MGRSIIKKMVMFVVICILPLSMVSCSKKVCEQCNKKKFCSTYIITYDGKTEEGNMCSDCAAEAREKYEVMGGTVEKK